MNLGSGYEEREAPLLHGIREPGLAEKRKIA